MHEKTARGHSEPAQPLLPGINFIRLLAVDESPICVCGSTPKTQAPLLCRDAPWVCPRGVPPASSTGVHGRAKTHGVSGKSR